MLQKFRFSYTQLDAILRPKTLRTAANLVFQANFHAEIIHFNALNRRSARGSDRLIPQGESILKTNKASKTVFVCQTCGYQSLKWMGKYPECSEGDSLVEERQSPTPSTSELVDLLF